MRALVVLLLVVFGLGVRPTFTLNDFRIGDDADYAFSAVSLLHGQYVVDWQGWAHVPRQAPGFPILLVPAVGLGGVDAAAWVPYLSALLLGVLAARLAGRLGGTLAAPVAAAAVLFHRDIVSHARLVMSDLPSATLALAELTLLVLAVRRDGRRIPVALAGVLAGYLPMMRPPLVLLLLAGAAGLSALPNWRRTTAVYLLSSAPLLLVLGLWQWVLFGSPLVTGYQAQGATSDGTGTLEAMFAPRFVLGPPWNVDAGTLPNAFVYALHLVGLDGSSLLPGLGAVGLVALALWARESGAAGVVGRFGLVALAVTLATYLPYFWQDTRFLMTPTILVTFAGAVTLARLLLARSRARARPGLAFHGAPSQ